MMNLIIDNGNTRCKAYAFSGNQKIDSQTYNQTIDLAPFLRQHSFRQCIVSSVGAGLEAITEALHAHAIPYLQLEHRTALPLRNNYKSPHTLGLDRIAAAVGAWQRNPNGNSLVVDMGTAITIDFVHESGTYMGGNISPGVHTRFKALHHFTQKLPLVTPSEEWDSFGTDTASAIRAGVQQGVHYELLGYIEHFQRDYKSLTVFLTGGEAFFFAQKFKNSIFASELVAEGLNAILNFNIDQ